MPESSRDLWRLHGAGRDDHLGIGACLFFDAIDAVGDTDGALALDQDAGDMGVRFDPKIRAVPRRGEEGPRGAFAAAVALGDLVVTKAILLGHRYNPDCGDSPSRLRHR